VKRNFNTEAHLRALSLLVFCPERSDESVHHVAGLDEAGKQEFFRLADAHHVVIRALEPLQRKARIIGDGELVKITQSLLEREHDRIAKALMYLERVCARIKAAGCEVTVIKTLDHWPDFGSDLDLFTNGDERRLVHVLKNELRARHCMRTPGDRIAHKHSFAVPGLPERVELHVNRLGPVGEHIKLAKRFITRGQPAIFNELTFQIPAPEDQVIAGTLQRMYRNHYIRICDVFNTAGLIERKMLDFVDLRVAAEEAGVWPGVATFLTLAVDHVKKYRGDRLELPDSVIASSHFRADRTLVRGDYFRFPVLPYGLGLYIHQLRHTARSGNIPGTARLSLVPPLASMGALAHAVTGNSGRVW
jgi:glycosyltransferase A (GT-A) superfamily protein (DUF2064 family)